MIATKIFQCSKCNKTLANRHSLSRHKNNCRLPTHITTHDFPNSSKKRSANMDGTRKRSIENATPRKPSKNLKMQAFIKEIINNSPQKESRTKKNIVGYSDEESSKDESDDNDSDSDNDTPPPKIQESDDDDSEESDDDDSDSDNDAPPPKMTKKDINGCRCSDKATMNDSNNDRDSNDDEKNIINCILPKTVDGLTDRFIERFEEFVCNGKAEHKNELMSLLNELLCKNGITKGQYNLLKHEIKKILDNPSPSIKCVMNEIIKPDVEELGEILKEVKKESDDDEKVLEVEKLFGAEDYIDDEPVFPMILKAIDVLEDLPIPKIKLKALQIKMLVKDIEKNKYRISSIFSQLQNARDKEDEQYILKQLGREELLSPEQVSQLSKLEESNSQSIADVI